MFNIAQSTIQRNGTLWSIHDDTKIHAFKDRQELLDMIQRRIDILEGIATKVRAPTKDGRSVLIKPYKTKEEL